MKTHRVTGGFIKSQVDLKRLTRLQSNMIKNHLHFQRTSYEENTEKSNERYI